MTDVATMRDQMSEIGSQRSGYPKSEASRALQQHPFHTGRGAKRPFCAPRPLPGGAHGHRDSMPQVVVCQCFTPRLCLCHYGQKENSQAVHLKRIAKAALARRCCDTQVVKRPHPACWMVKEVGQLTRKNERIKTPSGLPDGESGCAAIPASRHSPITFFTSHQGGWGRAYCFLHCSHSTLFTIRQAGWGRL